MASHAAAISSGVTRKAARFGEAVELRRIAEQCAIAVFAHIGDDALDGGQHSIERRAAAPFQRGEDLRCLLCASSFGPDQFSFDSPLELRAQPC